MKRTYEAVNYVSEECEFPCLVYLCECSNFSARNSIAGFFMLHIHVPWGYFLNPIFDWWWVTFPIWSGQWHPTWNKSIVDSSIIFLWIMKHSTFNPNDFYSVKLRHNSSVVWCGFYIPTCATRVITKTLGMWPRAHIGPAVQQLVCFTCLEKPRSFLVARVLQPMVQHGLCTRCPSHQCPTFSCP